jgi:hypothetical protein
MIGDRLERWLECRGTPTNWLQCARLAMLGLIFAGVVAFQVMQGAFRSEFGGEPDEAAHYVTGLMVHDYLASGLRGHPMAFARDFYEHYPKVALGHWPPGFYALQASWMLVFGEGRTSARLLMAALASLLAWTVFLILEKALGARWGALGALLLLLLPLTREYSSLVMTEIPLALLSLWGAICYSRYLERGRWVAAIGFGLIASAAILTKQSGLALAMVPLAGLVIFREWSRIRRWSFWLPALVVVALCAPWVLATLSLAADGMMGSRVSLGFTLFAVPYFAGKLHLALGSALAALALIGLFASRLAWQPSLRPMSASLLGLAAGTFALFSIVPAGLEARHMVPLLAPAIVFAVLGMALVAGWGVRLGLSRPSACIAVAVIVLGAFGLQVFEVRPKGYSGFRAVAASVAAEGDEPRSIVLIASDARGEGMAVSEFAMNEQRPGTSVRRASKLLATSSWSGAGYEPKTRTGEEVLQTLREEGVQFVVIDRSVPASLRVLHHDLLEGAMASAASQYRLVEQLPIIRAGTAFENGLEIYRRHD